MIARPPPLARPIASKPARSYPSAAASAPDTRPAVGYRHRFTIGGAAVPVASATLYVRNTDASTGSVLLAGIPTLDLSALGGAEVGFFLLEQLLDGSFRETEQFMFYFERTDVAETIDSYSVEISGTRQLTYGNPQTVALDRVLLQSATNGAQRWRIPMRKDLKPGDTATFESGSMTIRQVAYFIGPANSYLEISDG